jgi:hypothetical protein
MAEEGGDEKSVKVQKETQQKKAARGHRRRWSAPWRW